MAVDGMANISLTMSKVSVKCERKPMIMMEYQSQDFFDEENFDVSNHDMKKSAMHMHSRSSHKLLQDKNHQLK